MESVQTKRDRFQRLATKRTNEVLKKLEILGHCGNKHSYEYSRAEVDQIFLAVEKKLNEVKNRFKASAEDSFRLNA